MRTSLSVLALLGLLLAAGCATSDEMELAVADNCEEIVWFAGGVEQAFEVARAEDKPLFLYWGAVWCPPCNRVKSTIFTRQEFIGKSRLFVPVYLDGDTESAQIWGDKFDVLGYPSLLVFDSSGNEITRIPGGIDIEAFATILDLALNEIRPARSVLQAVIAGSEDLTEDDFKLLAYHSWEQDDDSGIPEDERVSTFRLLADRTPATLGCERSRLFIQYLMTALATESDEDASFELSAEEREEAVGRLLAMLEDPVRVRANLEFFRYYAGLVVGSLTADQSPERRELTERWVAAMESVWRDESLSVTDRLGAMAPEIQLCTLEDKGACVPPEIIEQVKERVAWAEHEANEKFERHATINTATSLLTSAGLNDEAKELLLGELDRSVAPYYLMGWLSKLAEETGDKEQAIDWLQRAYDISKGRATRFQWGTSYLIGLMDLAPDNGERIESEAVEVLGELLALDDAFNGRNKSRLARLEKRLTSWNEDGSHDSRVTVIREKVRSACVDLPEASNERSLCEQFLSPA
jgi:thioredoxin-related protein